ncbi:Hypothetical protein D9617_50g044290 [Elsinoe fawcettii]|nr:Hypothetical protein D9617_50g044290 [Elsinoe fawcettii]
MSGSASQEPSVVFDLGHAADEDESTETCGGRWEGEYGRVVSFTDVKEAHEAEEAEDMKEMKEIRTVGKDEQDRRKNMKEVGISGTIKPTFNVSHCGQNGPTAE